ncbi:glutamate receptor ionotropic, delta-2-like [Schistocerca americana]|uniref:glutamate receptor ionotropic, delta-2-like n=1 Tax=Schistocerca americana TaxID=7009 RepID=UPI001F501866|nr:glutamate receptor ionotropic, delta-2-like [Schistocerca americana]
MRRRAGKRCAGPADGYAMAGWWPAVGLTLSGLHACSALLDGGAVLMASDYFGERNTRVCAIYACSTYDSYRLWKHFSARHDTWLLAAPAVHRIPVGSSAAVFLDHDCAANRWIFSLSVELGLLNTSSHWLVRSRGPPPPGLVVRLDSDVTWATPRASGDLLLQQLTRDHLAGTTVQRPLGSWSPVAGLVCHDHCRSQGFRRNLWGPILRVGTVVTDLPLDNLGQRLSDVEGKYVDTMARFGWGLTNILSQKLNFTTVLYATASFGYKRQSENNTVDGLVGMLERGLVDVGSAGLVMVEDRLSRIDYAGPSRLWVSKIMFRHPAVVTVQGTLFRPLAPRLWLCVVLVFAALALVARAVCWAHGRPTLHAWGDTFLLVASASTRNLHPQLFASRIPISVFVYSYSVPKLLFAGSSQSADWPSWRILLVVSLVCAMLLDTHYSAAIVSSLLLPPPRTINTKEDLLQSPLEFGIENISYVHNLIEMSEDPVVRSLYLKKVAPPGAVRSNYFSLEEGMTKVATEMFAFHSQEFQMYPLVEKLFTEHDKCALVTIPLLAPRMTYVAVGKNSPLRETFTVGMRTMWEQGHLSHLRMRWNSKKPSCIDDRDFASVDLATISPAFMLLVSAMLLSLLLLLQESARARPTHENRPANFSHSRPMQVKQDTADLQLNPSSAMASLRKEGPLYETEASAEAAAACCAGVQATSP